MSNTAAEITRVETTPAQFLRIARDFRRYANGMGEVFSLGGTVYYLGSELETLLLLKTYRFNKDARQGYSANRKSSYFSLTLDAQSISCPNYHVGHNSAEVVAR